MRPEPVPNILSAVAITIPASRPVAGYRTLITLLLDANTPVEVKARVADWIFNHAAKAIEIEDVEARAGNWPLSHK